MGLPAKDKSLREGLSPGISDKAADPLVTLFLEDNGELRIYEAP